MQHLRSSSLYARPTVSTVTLLPYQICVGKEPTRKDFMMYSDITAWLGHKAVDLLKIGVHTHGGPVFVVALCLLVVKC